MVQHSYNESVSYVSALRAFTFLPTSFSLKSSIEISLVLRLISENRLLSIYPTEIAVFLPSLFEFSLTKTLLSRFVALRRSVNSSHSSNPLRRLGDVLRLRPRQSLFPGSEPQRF